MNTRRRLLRQMAGLIGLTALPVWAAESRPTPRQPAGPFYPAEPPLDDDNDLVHVAGQDGVARGEVTDLRGRLLDRDGRPLVGARIEIWQCDANGRYRHPHDPGRRAIDPGFQGFGHSVADAAGGYRFLTIRPVPYPGRTPHIHVAVYPPGEAPFVTQLYVADEARNADDFLYRRVPLEQRPLVTAAFVPSARPGVALEARWDVILGVAATA